MGDLDAFDRVIASIHDAMLDDSRWRESSALIDEACGTKGNHLVILDSHVRGPNRSLPEWLFDECYFRGELRQELAREYLEDFFPHDERVPRLMQLPDRRVTHVSDLYSERELKTSATYNDFLRRAECQCSLHVRMNGPDGLDVILVFADPIDAAGWSSGRIETLERLVGHIRQFVRVRHALVSADGLAASLADLLDRTEIGVIYLDHRGMIVNANSNACAVLREGDGLSDRGGFLRARLAADDGRLGSLLRDSLPGRGRQPAGGSMTVERSPLLPRLVLHVQPVTGRHIDSSHSLGGAAPSVAALVLVVDPGTRTRIDAGIVAETFHLTRAESQVAVALAEGSTVRDIATATHRQVSSVKWLAKQIHAKCGITRRAELAHMVISAATPPRDTS